jgi:glycosyltransferase involved in cell wall biosynthesis
MVIEPKDPEGIARAIEELIAKPELYLKLSKQGSEWVRENLSPQLQFQQIWKVFENAREKGKRS